MTRSPAQWRRRTLARRTATRRSAPGAGTGTGRERQQRRREDENRHHAQQEAARTAGQVSEDPGPPPNGFSLLPWLLMGMGALSHLFQGETPNPWIGGLGLLTFNSLYIYVAFRAFAKETRDAVSTRVALVLLGLVTCALALGYGGNWLLFFPLLGLATGAVLRGAPLRGLGIAVAVLAGTVSSVHDGWGALTIAYATWISTMVTAAILSLSEAVRELRAAREELARRAVEEERLRFSRDLHDLLGHTLSVIVVKSEAARRLAPRDMDAALSQVTDIEAVGRQALTEIREAVTGYREGSLATELERARSALSAAGVEPTVNRSGPPPEPQTAALLGWVVRETVTNVIRHSEATRCAITVSGTPDRVRLTVTDDGVGLGEDEDVEDCCARGGTGLTGLRERLAAAGGSLTADRGPNGGFRVTAELPADTRVDADARVVACARIVEDGGADADADGNADSRADADAGGNAAGTVSDEGARGGGGARDEEGVRSSLRPESPHGARSAVGGPNLGP
ncbi:two-component system sensor histidine kinase DesK [Streptomyces achromogenes]|uniref:Two-component system sensor histidine kinase DesK n=1 Tax=Streptomyces achromogenes TaxID=67255 RepID=A0ABU0PYF4_STRAH|nr:sensor histidine kinase [Streptomyces achromogenes]MDQ0683434.1 two-component system sensor histidine kinase DesK [Streptomyces achromogenes]